MSALELNKVRLRRVISGGQQGADQGGLLAAAGAGVETGGQAPEDFMTLSGKAPWLKKLGLTAAGTYDERTKVNISSADATVVFASNFKSPGTKLTVNYALSRSRPTLCLNPGMNTDTAVNALVQFIMENRVATLNVAGNRDNRPVGGEHACFAFEVMTSALSTLKALDLLETKERQ
jgi:hypothetical protein